MTEFVVAKSNLPVSADVHIEKDDVGIMESHGDGTKVFFIRLWQSVQVPNDAVEAFEVTQTGDAYDKKICNVCHKLKDTQLFDRNQNGVNNRPVRRPSCKTCRKILDGMAVKHKTRGEWLTNKPVGVPFECPICGKRTIAGVTSKVVLDHNHLTGEPRAWICDSCNTGIGRFKDDAAILQRAIKFLE
jgi:hypothetical protein